MYLMYKNILIIKLVLISILPLLRCKRQHSRIKLIASLNAQPQIQPRSLAKLIQNRSAFKLLDLCLSLSSVNYI